MPATTSAARQPPTEQSRKPVTVLVTGFGPFLTKYPKNSSWEIASTLPALLPTTPTNKTPIHIHVHHEAIRVAYNHVTSLVPTLLPPTSALHPTPDIILHIGLAAGRQYFTLEHGAHARGYSKIPDVDGEKTGDVLLEVKYPRTEFPEKLCTAVDTSDVITRWKAHLGYAGTSESDSANGNGEAKQGHRCDLPDVRLSPDAGNFMCGFIYFNSLAHYYSIQGEERPVVFLHVPDLSGSEEKLQEGWRVTVALIKALVESLREVGLIAGGREGDVDRREKKGVEAETDNNFA